MVKGDVTEKNFGSLVTTDGLPGKCELLPVLAASRAEQELVELLFEDGRVVAPARVEVDLAEVGDEVAGPRVDVVDDVLLVDEFLCELVELFQLAVVVDPVTPDGDPEQEVMPLFFVVFLNVHSSRLPQVLPLGWRGYDYHSIATWRC